MSDLSGTWKITTFAPSDGSYSPIARFDGCTDVHCEGPVLYFTDDKGVQTMTSLPFIAEINK